jgi:hypothetical protein
MECKRAIFLIAFILILGCGNETNSDSEYHSGVDADIDADTDADTDIGTDTDTDTEPGSDVDADADADGDSDGDTDSYDSCEDPLEFVDVDSILPPQGVAVTSDYDPLKVQIRAPMAKPECPTDADVEIYISATTDWEEFQDIYGGTVVQGGLVTAEMDLAGYEDGDEITISFSINAEGAMVGVGLDVYITYGGPNNPVEVESCIVHASNVGSYLDIRCRGISPLGAQALADGWAMDGGPEGAEIDGGLITVSDHEMGTGDVAWHDYMVTVTDGISESASLEFSVPIDVRLSYLSFVSNGNVPVPDARFPDLPDEINHSVLLPESAADAVAETCAEEFDTGDKPDTAADEPYVLSIEGECAREALANLPEAESAALFNYPVWIDDDLSDVSFGEFFAYYYQEWLEAQIEYRSEVE